MRNIKKIVSLLCLLAVALTTLSPALGQEESVALYTAKALKQTILRQEKDKESQSTGTVAESERIKIYQVDPTWVLVQGQKSGAKGYMLRDRIYTVEPVDPVNTPPYGVEKFKYIGVTTAQTKVYYEPNLAAESYVTLEPGAQIAILDIADGWGRVIRWRSYAYVDMRAIGDLVPVSYTDSPISGETPIAAYTSYYSVATHQSNVSRMLNIEVACEKLSVVFEPGEELDFNRVLGPYSKASGYEPAPILAGGTTTLGYGGGTCQVSSTFYNVALQLPGIEIVKRRPHGPSGAKYLPHGMDAAVGNESINLIVKNNYSFPIRIEASAQDGALYIVLWREG